MDWDAPLYWAVDCLAVANEAVYVVVNSTNIFALDKVSGAVTSLSQPFRPGSSVFTVAILNETLYLGGQFEMAGPAARTNLAAINRLNGAVLPWNPNPDRSVLRIAATCERIYVTGGFDNIAGTFRRGLAALDPVSGAHMWPASSQFAAQSAEAFAVFQDRVFVAGQSITVDSPPKPAVFRPLISIDTATGLLSANQPAIGGRAFYVAQSGSRLLAAGFLLTKTETRYRLAALDSITGRPLPWAPEISGIVSSLAWAGNRLFAAGNFSTVNGQKRKGFAAFDWPSGQLSTWDPQVTITNTLGHPEGAHVLVRSNLVFLSGYFTSLNGSNRQFLGAVDSQTAAASSFNVGLSNANNGNGIPAINSMIISSNTLLVAGGFTHVGGLIRTGLAAITLNSTGTITVWNPSPSRTNSPLPAGVSGAVLSGSSLFVSGGFDQIGGHSRNGLAEIDINSGAAMAWHPVATATTVAATLAADARAIYLAGVLTVPSHPLPVSALAFTRDGKLTSWQPQPVFFPRVFTSEGKVILAGGDNVSLYGFIVNALQVYNAEGAPSAVSLKCLS